MKAIKYIAEHLELLMLMLALAAIALVMLAQIIARYIFASPMIWPEELCRVFWIWTVFLSLPYTIRRGSILRVSVLADALPPLIVKLFYAFADFCTVLIMLIFLVSSFKVTSNYIGSAAATPAMALPYWAIYGLLMNIGFLLGAVRAVQQLLGSVKLLALPCEADSTESREDGRA